MLQNIISQKLSQDKISENYRRQVKEACFSLVEPSIKTEGEIIHFNKNLKLELGLEGITQEQWKDELLGRKGFEGIESYSWCYGGHQFGSWAGQLGDGRAINLGELKVADKFFTLQLKGAGETPYSRSADGRAVLRSSIREYLISEAIHCLGIPTTRALSLGITGEKVLRDPMYNGNVQEEIGAIVCRVSPGFIRFGNFELFSARQDINNLKLIAHFVIENYYSHLSESKDPYKGLLSEIIDRTLSLVVEWQRVGFIHAVMNTDNMSIIGETIDYGPFGWLDEYDPGFTPNTSDNDQRRYAFGNQPWAAQWNLVQLLNAFYPLVEDKDFLQSLANAMTNQYRRKYWSMMRSKLGLFEEYEVDLDLIEQLEKLMYQLKLDYTIFFRELSNFDALNLDNFAHSLLKKSSYGNLKVLNTELLTNWLDIYKQRLEKEIFSSEERKKRMNQVNPKYIIRNYMLQMAIDKTNNQDYSMIDSLFELLQNPYDEQLDFEEFYAKSPLWSKDAFGGSRLSCSS
jgi:uncharacterized protein YdiU (UPF0061 family)